jgi:Protein of unknown function (DUF4230)
MKRIQFMLVYTAVVILFTCLVTVLGTFVVKDIFDGDGVDKVTNDIVVEKITEQNFLVSRTVYTDQTTQIKIDQGSAWSNFFWGKSITAEGRVRTDVGYDLSELSKKNVDIDNENKVITLKGLEVTVLDSSVTSDLETKSGGSIIRKLLKDEHNKDYEEASKELTEAATRSVMENEEFKSETELETEELLSALFSGYDVEIVAE